MSILWMKRLRLPEVKRLAENYAERADVWETSTLASTGSSTSSVGYELADLEGYSEPQSLSRNKQM